MPTAPFNTQCRELGCHNLKTDRSTFCLVHGGAQTAKGKANGRLYAQSAWHSIRARQLSKQPLCARCQCNGRVTAAYHVDHVFPHRRDPKAFKVNLFQSLCAACHTLKTKDENTGLYKHYTNNGVIEYTDNDYLRIVGKHY